MGELLDDPRSRHLLEVPTRLAELHAEALDLADAEALAYEAVDIHITHGHLPSSFTRPQSNLLYRLGCNDCQRLTRWSSFGVEVPVAFEPLPGYGLHRLDGPKLGLAWGREMDRLYRHGPIMHQSTVEARSSAALETARLRLGGLAAEVPPEVRDEAGDLRPWALAPKLRTPASKTVARPRW